MVREPKKLRHYFLAHTIVVRTDLPLKQVLYQPDSSGRLTKWSIEMSEFDVCYEAKKALKA